MQNYRRDNQPPKVIKRRGGGWAGTSTADHESRLLSLISFSFLANICCLSYFTSLPRSYCAGSKTCDLYITRQCTTCSLFSQAGKGHKSSQAIFNYFLSLRLRLHLYENQKQIKVRQRQRYCRELSLKILEPAQTRSDRIVEGVAFIICGKRSIPVGKPSVERFPRCCVYCFLLWSCASSICLHFCLLTTFLNSSLNG